VSEADSLFETARKLGEAGRILEGIEATTGSDCRESCPANDHSVSRKKVEIENPRKMGLSGSCRTWIRTRTN
jgi:hypothetical protein